MKLRNDYTGLGNGCTKRVDERIRLMDELVNV